MHTQIRNKFDFSNPYYICAENAATVSNVLSIADFIDLFPAIELGIKAVNSEQRQLRESDDIEPMKNKNVTEFWAEIVLPVYKNLMIKS